MLASIRNQIKPNGSCALRSDDPASDDFTERVGKVFDAATAYNLEFPNPYTNSISVNSVYVAQSEGREVIYDQS